MRSCRLFACIAKTIDNANSAFYLLKYRGWEMLAGGLVYFISKRTIPDKPSSILAIAGIALVVFSAAFFSSSSSWPGWRVALPVLGASLIILARKNTFPVYHLPFFQWIGSRSYSIYLWHWPVVALLGYFGKSDSTLLICAGIIFSIAAGDLSYRFVENKGRRKSKSRKDIFALLAIAGALTASAALIIKYDGLASRVPEEVVSIRNEKTNINVRRDECDSYGKAAPVSCVFGGADIRAIVLGDSHAHTMVTAVENALPDPGDGIVFWGRSACPFIAGARGVMDEKGCEEFYAWVLTRLKSEPANIPLIVINRLSYYLLGANEGARFKLRGKPGVYFTTEKEVADEDSLNEYREKFLTTLCAVAKDREVYVLSPVPEMRIDVPQVLARAKMMGETKHVTISRDEYGKRHNFALTLLNEAHDQCGIKILDPVPFLCDATECSGDMDGRPLYSDDDHLSEYGNKLLVPLFAKIFNKNIAGTKAK